MKCQHGMDKKIRTNRPTFSNSIEVHHGISAFRHMSIVVRAVVVVDKFTELQLFIRRAA